ncbi:hypothetical protein [Actinomadura sp. 3N407]|uniref:hypothetical protein n=1 Tax=Actinomadura sp. 3N407 TaxID=3457423 RepID=UPI003FCC716D
MAAADWTGLGGPGDITRVRAAGTAAAIAAGTAGGHLYLRRRDGSGWRWEHVGTPPGAIEVLDATLLEPDPTTPAVVGDDLRVWLHRPEATPTPWTGLAGPGPDAAGDNFAACGDIVASHDAEFRHTLVVSSAGGRPWMRQGIDPDAIWWRLASDQDWIAVQLATALASVAPATEPQLHVFAVVNDRETFAPALKIAMLEDAAWTWIDPGGPAPGGHDRIALSATSLRAGDGRLQACAIVGTAATTLPMVIGSGRDWRWGDLGQPPVPREIGAAVVVDKGPDPRPGDEPVVLARVGHNIWMRSLTGDWTDLGTTPGDVAVVSPSTAVELASDAGRRRVWAAGASWDADLWSFESDETGVRWEKHGRPGALVAVVGAYTDVPDPDVSDRPVTVFAVDENGEVWDCRVWANLDEGFIDSSSSWIYHGPPVPGVTAIAPVGVVPPTGTDPEPDRMFVVGSDGHLWARSAGDPGWTWKDHGTPPGRTVKAATAPIITDMDHGSTVYVLADDGRLWLHAGSAEFGRWKDLDTPPGRQIFALAGAGTPLHAEGRLPVAAVITDDGRLWVHMTDVDASEWSDLGVPDPAEKIVAAIGVEPVRDPPDALALDIVVVGSPSGQVWSCRWTRWEPTRWTAHGRPSDARIRAAVGTMPNPADPQGFLASVIGNDRQIWVTASTPPGGAWTRWDPRQPTTTIAAGKTALPLDVLPCAAALDDEHRLHLVTPERGS